MSGLVNKQDVIWLETWPLKNFHQIVWAGGFSKIFSFFSLITTLRMFEKELIAENGDLNSITIQAENINIYFNEISYFSNKYLSDFLPLALICLFQTRNSGHILLDDIDVGLKKYILDANPSILYTCTQPQRNTFHSEKIFENKCFYETSFLQLILINKNPVLIKNFILQDNINHLTIFNNFYIGEYHYKKELDNHYYSLHLWTKHINENYYYDIIPSLNPDESKEILDLFIKNKERDRFVKITNLLPEKKEAKKEKIKL